MTVLVWLIPIALLLGLAGLGAFLWSLKSGQYDDLEGAASRILFDDDAGGEEDGEPERARMGEPDREADGAPDGSGSRQPDVADRRDGGGSGQSAGGRP